MGLDADTLRQLYGELRGFVEEEWSAQRRQYNLQIGKPLVRRLDDGLAVIGLRLVSVIEDQIYRFVCAENPSNFREGDLVRLHLGDPALPLAEMLWVSDGVLSAAQDYIELRPMRGRPDLHPGEDYTLDLSFIDLERQMLEAMETVARTERGRERILPLLHGGAEAEDIDPALHGPAYDAAADQGFNDPQAEAIAEGVASNWCCLIQGPPGTGKTRVLGEIVRQRVARDERVLISAFTHRAIHQALNAAARALPDDPRIAKVGLPIADDALRVPQYESFAETPFKDEPGSYVIGATPYAAFGGRLGAVDFDCLIIDEASQMTLPLAIMAMLRAECFVIIGDPRQLPPVLQSIPAAHAAEYSIFSRLEQSRERIVLEVTYRMNGPITAWASQAFYRSRLVAAAPNAERRLQLPASCADTYLARILEPSQPLTWVETGATGTRHWCAEEAGLCRRLVEELLRQGHAPVEIGIVTPFRRQARLIRKRLLSLDSALRITAAREVVVDTVERMQGQEREVILVSTAASDPAFLAHLRDFLYLPPRLNVAITRAKVKVIILASKTFLDTPDDLAEHQQEAFDHWLSLKAACTVVE